MKVFVIFLILNICITGFNYPALRADDNGKTDFSKTLITKIKLPDRESILTVEYQKFGNADQAMILLHGFGSSLYTWRNNVGPLAEHFTVYTYNQLGAGNSISPFYLYDLEAFRRQLLAFMDDQGIQKAILVGNSMGCQIALAFAGQYPDRVSGFVLIDPSGGSAASDKFLQSSNRIYENTLKEYGPETKAFIREILNEVYSNDNLVDYKLVNEYGSRWISRTSREAIRQTALDFHFGGPQYFYQIKRALWVRNTGREAAHRCLIIWGKDDPWFPVEGIADYEKVLRGSAVLIVDNAGHLPHEEAPALVNDRIINFLSSEDGKLQYEKTDDDWFIKNLESASIDQITYAADALGELKVQGAVKPLMNLIGNDDELVNTHVQDALAKIKSGVVDPAINALDDDRVRVRATAAVLLGKLEDGKATKSLIKMVSDPEITVCQNAIISLGQIKDPRAVQTLIGKLNDTEGEYWQNAELARNALVSIGEPSVKPLINTLGGEDANVKYLACDALDSLGESACEPLLAALDKSDAASRPWVIFALGKLNNKKTLPVLINCVSDPDPYTRWSAIRGLGELKAEEAIQPLIGSLHDEQERNRNQAVETFALIGTAAIPVLMHQVRSDTAMTQRYAAIALGSIGEQAIDSLSLLLKSRNDDLQMAAAVGLGKSNNQRALDPLIMAMETKNLVLRDTIAINLGKLNNFVVKDLIWYLDNYGGAARRTGLVYALGEMGSKEAVQPLIEMLDTETDSIVYLNTLIALEKLNDVRAVVPIMKSLHSANTGIRSRAANTLGVLKDRQAVPDLISALKDREQIVRVCSAWALGEIKAGEAVPGLIMLCAEDTSTAVRSYAVGALGEIKNSKAIEPLIKLLPVVNKDLQAIIFNALNQITGQNPGDDPVKWQDWWINSKSKM